MGVGRLRVWLLDVERGGPLEHDFDQLRDARKSLTLKRVNFYE